MVFVLFQTIKPQNLIINDFLIFAECIFAHLFTKSGLKWNFFSRFTIFYAQSKAFETIFNGKIWQKPKLRKKWN